MSRSYSVDFIKETEESTSDRTGVRFAKVCIKSNIPALYISAVMGVSRMTIYSWFRGKPLRDKNEEAVKLLINIIEADLSSGILPAKDLTAAKSYLESLTDTTIEDSSIEEPQL